MQVLRTLSWLFLVDLAWATLYTDVSQLPTRKFDFVVVGAGAGGNVLARRLTEDPNCTVLVIEAGISHEGLETVESPFLLLENIPMSPITWNYTTVPQVGLNNRILTYPRGRLLGGSTSINFMTYTRGANEDYDRWAKITHDKGWAWSNLDKYYRKSSRLVPSEGRNTTGLVDPAAHGFGPVEVSISDFVSELDDRVVNTSKAVPEFPFNIDFQSGNSVGVSLAQSAISNGTRSSSATAYLEPALNRTNLHVLIQNTVTKLIHTGFENGLPTFKQVEFAPNADSPRSTVYAKKEVLLCGGAVNTPQLLMLSGIGDREEIVAMGIKPLVHLPDVGKHLQDHPFVANYFTVNSTTTFDTTLRNKTVFNTQLAEWRATRGGPFADSPGLGVAFLRLPSNSSVFTNFTDPAPHDTIPHLEMIFTDGLALSDVASTPPTGNYLTVNVAVMTPFSLGSVRLASSDPFTFPLIDPNYFASPFDRLAIVEVVKLARQFVQTPAWDGFVMDRFGTVGSANTDDEIIEAARKSIVTIWHPVSSARMSPARAKWGVLDPKLRVKGTSGLRVIDASAFPIAPAGHPMAFVYIMAERASDLIKEAWSDYGDDY